MYSDFVKIIKKEFEEIRVIVALAIATEWTVTDHRNIMADIIVGIFSSNASKEVIADYIDLMWINTTFWSDYLEVFEYI